LLQTLHRPAVAGRRVPVARVGGQPPPSVLTRRRRRDGRAAARYVTDATATVHRHRPPDGARLLATVTAAHHHYRAFPYPFGGRRAFVLAVRRAVIVVLQRGRRRHHLLPLQRFPPAGRHVDHRRRGRFEHGRRRRPVVFAFRRRRRMPLDGRQRRLAAVLARVPVVLHALGTRGQRRVIVVFRTHESFLFLIISFFNDLRRRAVTARG